MEQAELIDELARRLGGRQAAVAALDAFADAITQEVASGGRVALTGFGVFDAIGGGTAAGPVPRFRPGLAFRDLVADPTALPQPDPFAAPEVAAPAARVGVTAGRGERRASSDVLPRQNTLDGDKLTFAQYRVPTEVSLSAVLPASSSRCGIYVLHFDDGHFYVGQALDVLTRFAAHRRRWGQRVVAVDFAAASPAHLDSLERRTIQRLERDGFGLYNSALVGLPMGESPLDLVVDRVEQERWLDASAAAAYDLAERLELARTRTRSGPKFRKLASRGDYQGIRFALFLYLLEVVPWPHETERRFWSMTSLPSTKRTREHHRLSAISINNVETLVVNEVLDEEGWFLGGFLNVAPGVASPHGWPMRRHTYRTVGEVDTIAFGGWEGLLDLLEKPDVIDAARQTALGLMRKGSGMMAKYHDENLADDVFSLLEQIGEGTGYTPNARRSTDTSS